MATGPALTLTVPPAAVLPGAAPRPPRRVPPASAPAAAALHRRAPRLLRALPAQLRAPGRRHRPHHVRGVSRRLRVPARGAVGGRGAHRLLGARGLLPRGAGLSAGLHGAGGGRVRRWSEVWRWWHRQHPSAAPRLPPQQRPAGRHAGSQRPGDAAQGKLLPGRLGRRLHHLVKEEKGPGARGGDVSVRKTTYRQHFSPRNRFSPY